MFIIIVHYKKPLSDIDAHLLAHREFLTRGYEKNYFLASGPQIPRSGGIIIALLKDRQQLEIVLKEDPFHIYDLANYEIIEFEPVKYHKLLTPYV